MSPPALAEQGTWRRASGSSVSSTGYGISTDNKRDQKGSSMSLGANERILAA